MAAAGPASTAREAGAVMTPRDKFELLLLEGGCNPDLAEFVGTVVDGLINGHGETGALLGLDPAGIVSNLWSVFP